MDSLFYGLEPNPLRKRYEEALAWKQFYGQIRTPSSPSNPEGHLIHVDEYFNACDLVQDAWDEITETWQ